MPIIEPSLTINSRLEEIAAKESEKFREKLLKKGYPISELEHESYNRLIENLLEISRESPNLLKSVEKLRDSFELLDIVTDYSPRNHAISSFLPHIRDIYNKKSKKFMQSLAKLVGKSVSHDIYFSSGDVIGAMHSYQTRGYGQFIDDVMESCSNKDDPKRAIRHFLYNVFNIFEAFSDEGISDMIPYYLEERKYSHGFSDPDTTSRHDIAEEFKQLKAMGDKKDIIIRLAAAEARVKGYSITGIHTIEELEKKGYNADMLFKEAEVICSWGVDGSEYLNYFTFDHRDRYILHLPNLVAYVKDLAKYSPACATEALQSLCYFFDDDTSSDDRDLILKAGIVLAEKFGDDAKGYFSHVPWEIKNGKHNFERILNAIEDFGNSCPRYLSIFASDGVRLVPNHRLESFTEISKQFIAELNRVELDRYDLYRKKEAIDEFFLCGWKRSSENPIKCGADPGVVMPIVVQFLKENRLNDLKDISKYIQMGVDYKKLTEIIGDISLNKRMIGFTQEIINSDLALKEKLSIIRECDGVSSILGRYLVFDAEGKWRYNVEEELKQKIKDDLGIETEDMPFNKLLNIGSLVSESNDKYRYALMDILSNSFAGRRYQKNFTFNPPYPSAVVGGLKEMQDPVELTKQFVYGIISRDPNKRSQAERYFEREKLEDIRSFIEPEVVFRMIKGYLPFLESGSAGAAREILQIFKEKYRNKESVSDIITSIEGVISGEERIDGLVVKFQKGTYEDLFDNGRILCCAFYPNGVESYDSINYLAEKNLGLLPLVPIAASRELDPIGMAISINTADKSGVRHLLVDGVEGGALVDRIRDSIWMPLYHNSILKLGKESGNKVVAYNTRTGNAKPRKFIDYVSRLGGERKTIELTKLGGPESLLDIYHKDVEEYLKLKAEADSAQGNPDLQSKLALMENEIAKKCSFYLDSAADLGSDLKPKSLSKQPFDWVYTLKANVICFDLK
jgi:hypothetical protein